MKIVSVYMLALQVAVSIATPALAQEDGNGKVTIGMVLEARPEVEPWSAAWYDASEKLKANDPLVEVMVSYDAYDAARAEPVARQMLDLGADALALTTFVLSDVAKLVAKDYVEVPMTVSSFGTTQAPNLSSVTASFLEIGYASCWLLTKLSDDGRIGVVGAQNVPFESEQIEGCEIGAKAANPNAEVVRFYTNSFTDTQANREQVQALLNQGISEIILVSGTEDTLGGMRLCEAEKANCTTWGGDARRWAPTSTVTTVILDWSVVLEDQVEQARRGQPEAKTYNLTFGNGGLKVPDFSQTDAVQSELQDEFFDMISDLANLRIELPESKVHPGLR